MYFMLISYIFSFQNIIGHTTQGSLFPSLEFHLEVILVISMLVRTAVLWWISSNITCHLLEIELMHTGQISDLIHLPPDILVLRLNILFTTILL